MHRDKIKQIALIKACPSTSELHDMEFEKWSFPSVFRAEPFPQQSDTTETLEASATSAGGPSNVQQQSLKATSTQVSYASNTPVVEPIFLNKSGQRIDQPLPYYLPAIKQSVEKRQQELGSKFCYEYYLGICEESCPLIHSERLSLDEIKVIRFKARSVVCLKRSHCRSFTCFFGHVCPYTKCVKGPNCKFHGLHIADTHIVETIEPET